MTVVAPPWSAGRPTPRRCGGSPGRSACDRRLRPPTGSTGQRRPRDGFSSRDSIARQTSSTTIAPTKRADQPTGTDLEPVTGDQARQEALDERADDTGDERLGIGDGFPSPARAGPASPSAFRNRGWRGSHRVATLQSRHLPLTTTPQHVGGRQEHRIAPRRTIPGRRSAVHLDDLLRSLRCTAARAIGLRCAQFDLGRPSRTAGNRRPPGAPHRQPAARVRSIPVPGVRRRRRCRPPGSTEPSHVDHRFRDDLGHRSKGRGRHDEDGERAEVGAQRRLVLEDLRWEHPTGRGSGSSPSRPAIALNSSIRSSESGAPRR